MARLGVRVLGIPLDRHRMRVDAWPRNSQISRSVERNIQPKYIYTVPRVRNPTATIMPEPRRIELLRLSEQYGVPIFEEDCYADLIWR